MLLRLPDELLLAVESHIDENVYLQALACTCTRLYRVTIPEYYKKVAKAQRCDPLVAAAAHGNLDAVNTLMQQGCSPSNTKPYMWKKYKKGSALVTAIEKGRADIAATLLESGADANADAGQIGNALQAACAAGMSETVRLLLRHGADARFTSGKNGSAMTVAARHGCRDALEALLDHGVEATILNGGNPVRTAAKMGHVECIKLLLDRGADVNYRTTTKGRALEAALVAEQDYAVRYLLERGAEDKLVIGLDSEWGPGAAFAMVSRLTKWCDLFKMMLDRMDYSSQIAGNNFVHIAWVGNEEVLDSFLRNGVDIKKHGSRALGAASVRGHLHILKRLFAAGVDVNEAVPEDGPAILQAVAEGHHECVKALIEQGASLNVTREKIEGDRSHNAKCRTPLQIAVWGSNTRRGDETMVRMLLEAGADPNVAADYSFYPLYHAVWNDREGVVRLLLEYGASKTMKVSALHESPLQPAVRRGNISMARLLLEHGAPIERSLEIACTKLKFRPTECSEMIQLLLHYGVDPKEVPGWALELVKESLNSQ